MKTRVERAQRENDKILEHMVKDHQENRNKHGVTHEDFIDILLKTQKRDDLEIPMTHNNIKALIWDMFAGGTAAPTAVTVWAMSEHMKNPKVMEKAHTEIRKVFNVKVSRENSEACVINGYEIPAKSKVIINAWAIGRESNSYDFSGTNFEYIPFGAGRRICPGAAFSMPYMLLSVANLLYHFVWELPNGAIHQELDMTHESFGLTVKRANDLCLIPIPYHPTS
ncbi:Cytochrome P450 71D10 [Glycine soja]